MNYIFYIIITLSIASCVTPHEAKPDAKSVPVLKEKISEKPLPKKQKLFVEEKKITIIPNAEPNTSGSLFNLNDERNYLFVEQGPVTIGKYLVVNVDSNRSQITDSKGTEDKKDSKNNNDSEKINDEDLLKSLPHLETDDKNLAFLKNFKMRVSNSFPNGDVLAVVKRSSLAGDDKSEVIAQARIPYKKLVSGEPINTSDLFDVKFVDNSEKDYVERNSTGWEDEYTARLSGFSEAKSKLAMKLEDKRKRLVDVKDRLSNKLTSFNKEREKLAKERNDLMEEKKKVSEKVTNLNEQIETKDKTISEQKEVITEKDEQIKDLSRPEEKPSDNEDGASGG